VKLRIRGDTIRLRLNQTEVATLAERGRVDESTAIGPGANERIGYAIVMDGAGGTNLVASLASPFSLEVRVAPDVVRTWAGGEMVGIEGAQSAGDGRTLRILVEKDYACLKERPDEDDVDAFPNPKA
jgi:hypothetical protein